MLAFSRSRRERPSADRRAEVEALLEHKWEGVQTVAGRVLGTWGGPESVVALRRWLLRLYERPYGWAARGVAAKSLARCVTEADEAWVLDLYFELPTLMLRHEVLPIVAALPREQTVERLQRDTRHADPAHRDAARKALTWMSA